jgi:membrane protein implicated in regulation of membrane protease activity
VPPTCTLQYVNAPTQTRTLADTGGLVVTDDGRRVLVFDRGTGALAVLAFVLGVLTLVVGGFGLVALVAGVPSRALGAAFLAVGLIIAAATYVVVRKIRHRRSRPLRECRPLAVIDRKLGIFSYGGGAVVSLDQVRFARRLQIGSSSPKLVAVTPGGTKVLKRGNPFDGGVGNVDELLTGVVRGR